MCWWGKSHILELHTSMVLISMSLDVLMRRVSYFRAPYKHNLMLTYTQHLPRLEWLESLYQISAYTKWDAISEQLKPSERPVVLNRASSTNTRNPFGSTFCYGYQDIIFEVIVRDNISNYCHYHKGHICTKLKCLLLCHGFLLRRLGSVLMMFVVGGVALGQDVLPVLHLLPVSIIPPVPHSYSFIINIL
jgi:hypothetical protein